MQHQATVAWLRFATALVIASGLFCLSGALPATSAATLYALDLVFWPLDGTPGEMTPQANVLWAISGGLVAGWGILIWQVVTHVYVSNPSVGRSMILTSVVTWFVLDSAGSVAAGAPMNALFNVGFLALYAVPLLRPVREAPGTA
ncbi:MAG: hypothetical protein AAF724_03810 [Pseudomonadota bacterium]